MPDERKLTEEDREKIQRLLKSGTLENVTLALSLIEETANQEDIAAIFTKDVIVELICLEDLRVMVRAGSIIMKCSKTWKGFADTLADPLVMTSKVYQSQMLDLNDITSISPAAATELVADDWDISLNGLTNLSAAVAQCLGKTGGNLHFGGLTTLSDKAAKHLSTCGSLSLPVLTTLSDKAAKNLSTCGDLSLPGLTTLSDRAADHLSKQKGKLSLNALKSLTSEKGHLALVKKLCRQEEVLLHGLTSLTDENAILLGAHDKVMVSAKIKSQIKKAAAKQRQAALKKTAVLTSDQQRKIRKLLKSKDAKNIKLAVGLLQSTDAATGDWSQSFSSPVIRQLVNTWDCDVWNAVAAGLHPFSGLLKEFMGLAAERYLKISGSRQDSFICLILSNCEPPLSSVIGAILKNHKGTPLQLSGLTSLSDAAAKILSKHKGWIDLSGLTILSDGPDHIALVESLSKQGSSICLGSLTELSDAAAESLSKHKDELQLPGLTSLSDAAAESLSNHEGKCLTLEGLTILSDAASESLSKYEGWLYLGGLTSLSDAAAEGLGKHHGELSLEGLTILSDSAAESLSKHEGDLVLDGLKSLSDAAAEALGKHHGELWLRGLTELSDAAAKHLSKHPKGWGISRSLYNLPASAAKILRDAGHG